MFLEILHNLDENFSQIKKKAKKIRDENFSNKIFYRGLLEISNVCKNDCYYCGIRKSNLVVERYSLSEEQIFLACDKAFQKGFKTFVLQSGDFFSLDNQSMKHAEFIASIVYKLKNKFSDIAVTLSLGEASKEIYKLWKDAGADRYLLRHESASESHFKKLHPENQSLSNRKKCLFDLKDLGYQVGAGFMVGSPFQTVEDINSDLMFLKELQPQMIGIGPFISHFETPFKDFKNGSVKLTLFLISLLRIIFPKVLIPSTTALASLSPSGLIDGIEHGANVIMPNITPSISRKKYELYETKNIQWIESIESIDELKIKLKKNGYELFSCKGDYE